MHPTEDRNEWYKKADNWEAEFVKKYGNSLSVIINPSKSVSKFAPDLFLLERSVSGDLKILREPFYKSEQIYRIPPQHCWTFNPSDLFEYSTKYSDNFCIYIWKMFQESSRFNIKVEREEAVYYVSLYDLKKLIMSDGKIHHYIRRMNDTNGNSYGSYGIDLRRLNKVDLLPDT